jgi:hypothetical protein
MLELGYEQRQLVSFAAVESSLWHPLFDMDTFMVLCKITEKIRLHAISLRRALQLTLKIVALRLWQPHIYPHHTNTAEIPAPFVYSVVKGLDEPLVHCVGCIWMFPWIAVKRRH